MRQLSERFHRRWRTMVDVQGPEECWPWQGRPDAKGYGFVKVYGTTTRVHRVAWALANNGWPPPGQVVRHTCDNPPCCNPRHLELGTVADNVRDCITRGRRANGEPLAQSRLTNTDVLAIRRRAQDGETARQIAPDYGVTRQCISLVIQRRNWRHVA
jgi:hypothetical protein